MSALFLWLSLSICQDQEEKPAPQPQDDDRVVIVAVRREADVRDVPSGVSVITREQIERSGATDIRRLLELTPSAFGQGANQGSYDSTVDLRGYNNGGGNGQRTLVLVDGRRTNHPTSSATDWSSIPVGNIERIEIIRGPAVTLYGDPALAAVIHIVTRKGHGEPTLRATAAAGAYQARRGLVEFHGASDGTAYSLFVQGDRTDGWRDNGDFKGVTSSARLEAPLGSDLVGSIKIGVHDDERGRPGTLSEADIAALGRRGTTTPDDRAKRFEVTLDAGLVYSNDSFGELSVHVSALRGDSEANFDFGAFGNFLLEDEFTQLGLYLKHLVPLRLFDRDWKLSIGLDLVHEDAQAESGMEGDEPTEADYLRRLVGAWAHLQGRVTDTLAVSASLRFDRARLTLERMVPPGGFGDDVDTTKVFDQFSPSVGATLHATASVSVYIGYGRPFKYPTRDELVGFFLSDPQLIPERSHSYEAGVRVFSGRRLSASLGVYRMDVKNEIFFDSITFSNLNLERVLHQGVEFEFRAALIEASDGTVCVDVFGAYAFTDAEIRSGDLKGNRYPVTPPHAGHLGVTLSGGPFSLTLTGRFVGRRLLINDVDNTADPLPSYTILNLRAGARVDKTTISLIVDNALDREFHDSGGTTFFGPRFNPAPERNWWFSVETEF